MKNLILSSATILGLVLAADAATGGNLVQNGKFETLTTGSVNSEFPNVGNGYLAGPIAIADWTFSAPETGALYAPGAADTVGASTNAGYTVELWGPGNGVENGMPAASPAGGNIFMADDPADYHTTLSQTIDGLAAGTSYSVSFYWAAAEVYVPQTGAYNAATQNQIEVSLGSQSQSTALVSIAEHGFSGWMTETFKFRATSSSEVLSFLFESPTAEGAPPAALLSAVQVNAIPEPQTWSLMIVGLGSLGALARRRRARRFAI